MKWNHLSIIMYPSWTEYEYDFWLQFYLFYVEGSAWRGNSNWLETQLLRAHSLQDALGPIIPSFIRRTNGGVKQAKHSCLKKRHAPFWCVSRHFVHKWIFLTVIASATPAEISMSSNTSSVYEVPMVPNQLHTTGWVAPTASQTNFTSHPVKLVHHQLLWRSNSH